MKKKLICVLSLVLVVCFVWVVQVNAISNDSVNVDEMMVFVSAAQDTSSSSKPTWYRTTVIIDGELKTFVFCYGPDYSASVSWRYFYNIFYSRDLVLSSVFVDLSGSFNLSNIYAFNLADSSSSTSYFSSTNTVSNIDIVYNNSSYNYDCVVTDISVPSFSSFNTLSGRSYRGSTSGKYLLGFLCDYQVLGLSDEEKSILQQILLGVDSANQQLDQMQSEQSSYYEDILQSEASDTDVIAEASSKREEFDEIMNEYSSLNAELARPDVDELLPDYSNVVNGFKDDKFYESFDVFYDNAYIMFMLLATFFFATLSYIIFGKKA